MARPGFFLRRCCPCGASGDRRAVKGTTARFGYPKGPAAARFSTVPRFVDGLLIGSSHARTPASRRRTPRARIPATPEKPLPSFRMQACSLSEYSRRLRCENTLGTRTQIGRRRPPLDPLALKRPNNLHSCSLSLSQYSFGGGLF